MYTIVIVNFETISEQYTRCLGLYKTNDEALDELQMLLADVKTEFGECVSCEYEDGFGIRDMHGNVLLEAWITVIEQ